MIARHASQVPLRLDVDEDKLGKEGVRVRESHRWQIVKPLVSPTRTSEAVLSEIVRELCPDIVDRQEERRWLRDAGEADRIGRRQHQICSCAIKVQQVQALCFTPAMKAIVALVPAWPFDDDLLGLLVLGPPLVLRADPRNQDLGQDERALSFSGRWPRVEVPRLRHVRDVVRVDACALHNRISYALELWVFLGLPSDFYPCIFRLLDCANLLLQPIYAGCHRVDISAVGIDGASDDDDVWQLLAPRCLVCELLYLRIGLKEADDAVGFPAAAVNRIASKGHRCEANGNANGVRPHRLAFGLPLLSLRNAAPEGPEQVSFLHNHVPIRRDPSSVRGSGEALRRAVCEGHHAPDCTRQASERAAQNIAKQAQAIGCRPQGVKEARVCVALRVARVQDGPALEASRGKGIRSHRGLLLRR
mmetsp:Transcript_88938/g.247075  ORF Transcript_88938/g.247075 Transcript_88938/m.247075 type:complete len:418 (-) Transcript_88938:68-1321(-)